MSSTIYSIIGKYIKLASDKYEVAPCDVTSSQFWSLAAKLNKEEHISEWELRKLGGYIGIRDTLFPSEKASKIQPRLKKKFKLETKKLINFKVHEASVASLFQTLKLNKNDTLKIVVQPDTHCPEHDKKAIEAFCKFLTYYKPHGLINLGDFMEMAPVSHWENDSMKPRRLVPEIKEGRVLLKKIGEAAGPQCVFKRFLIGNHEDWLQQYLTAKIPEILDGIDELGTPLKIEELLTLKELGYRTIPLNEILKVGSAHFIHGYYTGNHHAKKHLDVFGVNLYYGHLHDVQCYSGVSVNGLHEAMSIGCLRTLTAPFLKGKPNNWMHSFLLIEMRSDGSYTRYCPIIINGKFSFNGKVFGS